MGTLSHLRPGPIVAVALLAGGLGFLAGQHVGEGELRHLLTMPHFDGKTPGLGLYPSRVANGIWSKQSATTFTFTRIATADDARVVDLFAAQRPPAAPPPPSQTPAPPPAEESTP